MPLPAIGAAGRMQLDLVERVPRPGQLTYLPARVAREAMHRAVGGPSRPSWWCAPLLTTPSRETCQLPDTRQGASG